MTYAEFTPEILRLYRGFKAEDLLTPDRLKALFDGLQRFSVGAVRDAVSAALRDPKLPWFDRFHELVEQAEDAEHEFERRQWDRGAKEWFQQAPEPIRSQPWAKAHHEAIVAMVDGDRQRAQEILASVGSPAAPIIAAQHLPLVQRRSQSWVDAAASEVAP